MADDILYAFFLTWAIYLGGAVVPLMRFAYCFFRKVPVSKFEYSILVIPFGIWFALFLSNLMSKSLANLVEAMWLGGLVSALCLVRILFGKNNRHAFPIFFVCSCVASLGIYFFVPGLPE